jgi:hypothetical protein
MTEFGDYISPDQNGLRVSLPRLVGHRSNTRFVAPNWEVLSVRRDHRPATIIRIGFTSMTELTRRIVLTGTVAASAATALMPLTGQKPAHAAASAAGAQAPGFYRYKVGSFECTSINDGARSFPMPDPFVRNVPKAEALAAAEAAYMPKGGNGAVQSAGD